MKKTLLLKTMLLLCAILFGTSAWADDITLTASSGFGASYVSSHTFTAGGIGFTDSGVMYNGKGSPSGFAKQQVIQMRKSGNSGAGTIYNTGAISTITSVEVTLVNNNNGFTLYYGTSENPSTNSIASSSLTPVTGTFSYTNTDGGTSSATSYKFTFNLNSYNATFIKIVNGGSANYVGSIVINYSSGPTTYSVTYNGNGNTSGTVPTDATAYTSGATVTVLGNTGSLAKSGYTFGGWNTQADGQGTNYTAGNTFTISANTTLYAKWTAKTITGLSYTGTPTKTTYNAGESFDPTGLTVTATFDDESADNVTTSVSWTPDPLTEGTTSVTGTYMGQTVNVSGLTVNAAPGSENNPYTVAQAIAATPSSDTSANVYIHGIVSGFYGDDIMDDGNNYRYYISDDGTTTNQLLVYKGKGLNNVAFSNANDLLIGDEVVICGGLTTYNSTKEVASGNYLVSRTAKPDPTFTVSPSEYTLSIGNTETVDVTLTTNTDGVITCESDDEDVATVALKSEGVYTITAVTEGTATITISSAESVHYKSASATVNITVNDNRKATTTTISSTGITNTDVYVGTDAGTLTATVKDGDETVVPGATVTWSSNATGVATIDESTGAVTLVAPGDVTFTATYAGDATYKVSNATFNMTVTTSEPGKTFYLVTDANQLADGDKIILVYGDYAMSTTQAANNRPATDIEKKADGSIMLNTETDVQVLTLEKTETPNVWYMQTEGDNYLYAASSSNNYLRTDNKETVGNNAKAAISFSEDHAHIVFQGSNTRNELRFNPNASNNNPLFSCYLISGNTGDPDVQVYKEALPVTVTIPAGKEWITFCSTANLDFSEAIEGLKGAYTITAHADKAITLTATEMTGTVKAGTGLLLRAAEKKDVDQVIAIPVAATGDEQTDNMLIGVTEDTYIYPTPGEYTNLGLSNGAFHPYIEAGTLAAGKAYLRILTAQMPTGGNNAKLIIVFDGEATGIANLNVNDNDSFDANAPMYNLAGQRVNKSYKGVVIVNGKKVVRK